MKRKRSEPPRRAAAPPPASRPRPAIGLRRLMTGGWELVHPRCALERQVDLEEVQAMVEAGEAELAVEELRWLLEDCRDFLSAHQLLGELAMEAGDAKLARAHFGYAYQLGLSAIEAELGIRAQPTDDDATTLRLPDGLPYAAAANQDFFHAAKGLAWALGEIGLSDRGQAVCRQMLDFDASDPLGFAAMLERLTSGTPPRPS